VPRSYDAVLCVGGAGGRSSWSRATSGRVFTRTGRKGLPEEATLYTLRHTFATLWLESGENPKVLQEILGHSRIDVTLNVYSHVLPHIQHDAMGRFGRRFFGRS
jgi:integrase